MAHLEYKKQSFPRSLDARNSDHKEPMLSRRMKLILALVTLQVLVVFNCYRTIGI